MTPTMTSATNPTLPMVLVVDDDPGIRLMLSRLVQRAGFAPLTAGSGTEAFTELVDHHDRIALIFLDLRMPEMDGFGFRALQLETAAFAAIPTIVMTGQTVSGDDVMRLNPTAWVPKPANLSQFTEALVTHARPLPGRDESDETVEVGARSVRAGVDRSA